MNENIFSRAAKVGVLLLLACGILNLYGTIRYLQEHRRVASLEQQVNAAQQKRQRQEAALNELIARAQQDVALQEALKRATGAGRPEAMP